MEKIQESKKEIKEEKIVANTSEADLKALIEKNIRWSQAIFEQNKKIKRSLTMMVVADYLRLSIILIPIILGIIYLPPLLKDLFVQYGSILGGMGGAAGQPINSLLNNASPDQIQEALKLLQSYVK